MLKTIPSSAPWSSSDYGNLAKGSSDNISNAGEEEELGKPIGLATMILSYITRKEINFKGFKMYLKVYS